MTALRSSTRPRATLRALAASACLAAAACATGAGASGGAAGTPPASPSGEAAETEAATPEAAATEGTAGEYTEADVAFMRGMIHHHAQAVVMARMAPSHGASPALRRLTARILNSQKTEIGLMQDWLRDRGEPVPEPRALTAETPEEAAPPGGWDAGPQMAGILSDRQMAELDAARGEEFDRLFLTYMIEHHQGAVTMVENLVSAPRGAREEAVFRLASGIRSDQAAEIDRMRTMLREQLFGAGNSR